jgi:hypothetical protein
MQPTGRPTSVAGNLVASCMAASSDAGPRSDVLARQQTAEVTRTGSVGFSCAAGLP